MSHVLRMAVLEILGIEPQPDPADELLARLTADPHGSLEELKLVAEELPAARQAIRVAEDYEIRPGRCARCGADGGQGIEPVSQLGLCYDFRSGTRELVCWDELSCDRRYEGKLVALSRADEARRAFRRADTARNALGRFMTAQQQQMAQVHRGDEMEAVPAFSGWHATLGHPRVRGHLLGMSDRRHTVGHAANRLHLIGAR